MPYRSAILSAVEELRDHQTGSPLSSIRRHIKERDISFANALADPNDGDTSWNESLFLATLKSLSSVSSCDARDGKRRGRVLERVNGSNYKFSDEYLEERAGTLRDRAESMEERRRIAAANVNNLRRGREEPPRELPHRKTERAKVRIAEGRVITAVVNPPKGRKGMAGGGGGDEMETEDEEEGGNVSMDGNGGSGRNKNGGKKHVKIIPRKVCPKRMISDPMNT